MKGEGADELEDDLQSYAERLRDFDEIYDIPGGPLQWAAHARKRARETLKIHWGRLAVIFETMAGAQTLGGTNSLTRQPRSFVDRDTRDVMASGKTLVQLELDLRPARRRGGAAGQPADDGAARDKEAAIDEGRHQRSPPR